MKNDNNNKNRKKKTVVFKEINNNNNNNRDKNPLQRYRNKSKKKLQINCKKKDINSNNIFLSMEFNKVINDIRKQRLENKKELQNKNLKKITSKLDIKNIRPLSLKRSSSLNSFLKKVNYNFECQSLEINKKKLDYKITPIILTPPAPIIKTKVEIDCNINSIKDILKLIQDYPIKADIEYNINIRALNNIKEPLQKLDNMIGMNKLKNSVVDQILYYIQDLNKCEDFMHTVIYGPPGTGKTEIAKLVGYIFSSLGILKNNTFKKATRADLIAGYLGQTAMKTKQMIESCLGGVLFIDEAYSLGNSEKRDSFSKECIDTICETLSDYKSNIMVIVAGYKEELEECFFSYNKGLTSRFPWRFETDDYNSNELKDIFIKKVNDIEWKITPELKNNWFESKMDHFKYYGRDMETLLSKIKISHSRRVFCKSCEKKYLTIEDLNNGFEKFKENKIDKNTKSLKNEISLSHIYL
tara:strand:+ start:1510 stop:2916 length:1407 start_codon:yes stop_codon:yes gene_type:complete